MLLMGQYSFLVQVEEKADSILHAVKAHVEYANDVSFYIGMRNTLDFNHGSG